MVLAACDKRTAYLLLGFDPDITIFATTDGGLTWEQHAASINPPTDPRGAFCTADGTLVLAIGVSIWLSDDRGAFFTGGVSRADEAWIGRGLMWTRNVDAGYAFVSVDGRSWQRVKLNPE
jgi:hypothetical protein